MENGGLAVYFGENLAQILARDGLHLKFTQIYKFEQVSPHGD